MVQGANARFQALGCHLPAEGTLASPENPDGIPRRPEPAEMWIGDNNHHYSMNWLLL